MSSDDDKTPLPATLQALFLRDWWSERRDGITPRATHTLLAGHIEKDETFQREALERFAGLETNAERDAEERTLNGKGRGHEVLVIPPPPPVPRESKPWWRRDPWKGLIAKGVLVIAGLIAGYLTRHLGLKP